MQAHTEQLMSYQDVLKLANELAIKFAEPVLSELKEVKQELQQIKEAQQPKKKLVLTSAKQIGDHLQISEWQARDLMRHPNFPKSLTKRTGKYNRGKWKTEEVERFARINKGKV